MGKMTRPPSNIWKIFLVIFFCLWDFSKITPADPRFTFKDSILFRQRCTVEHILPEQKVNQQAQKTPISKKFSQNILILSMEPKFWEYGMIRKNNSSMVPLIFHPIVHPDLYKIAFFGDQKLSNNIWRPPFRPNKYKQNKKS